MSNEDPFEERADAEREEWTQDAQPSDSRVLVEIRDLLREIRDIAVSERRDRRARKERAANAVLRRLQ